MIKINRSPKPIINAQFDCLNGKNKEGIKKTLIKDTDDSCSFCCHSDISVISSEIEHFLPQSKFPSKRCDWDNLFWSCGKCNRTKSNQFYGIAENNDKGNLQALPLKFDDNNYKFHDWFDINLINGNIIELHKGIDKNKYERERTTIELFGLNQYERPILRLQEIEAYEKNPNSLALSKYRKLILHYFES